MGGTARPYVKGNFSFQLDGFDCGMIQSLEGGNTKAEVVSLANSSGYLQKKHLAGFKHEDFKMKMAGVQGKPLYEWIKAALDQNHLYKNGAIHAKNFNQETESIREFTDALLTEIGLPAGDGTAKDPAYLSISFAAQTVRNKAGDKSKSDGAINVNQKRLNGGHFKLVVDRVKDACNRVAKFDALTVKMGVQRDDIGGQREKELVPGKIDMPNLVFHVAEVDAKPIYEWHEDFVIKGNCGEESETTAELTYFSQDYSKPLIVVTMNNIGIFNLTTDSVEDHADAIRRVKVECYMEGMKIDFPGA